MAGPWEKYGQTQQVSQNPLFPGQMQGQGLNNEGQRLSNQEKAATVPLARPTAEANLTGQGLSNQRTQQDIGFDRLKLQLQIRDQFAKDPVVQRYRTTLPEVAKAMQAGKGKQGDLAVIYSFAKVMDPGSAVREGELQFANASASLIQRVRQYLAMVNEGKGLDPQVRRGLVDEMHSAASEYNKAYNHVYLQYRGMAQEAGFNPEQVIGHHDGDAYRDVERRYIASTMKQDPERSKALAAMIRGGASYDDAVAFARELGASPPDRKTWDDAVAFARKTGRTNAVVESPTNSIERALGSLVGPADVGLIKGGKKALDRAATGLQGAANLIPGINSNSATEAAAQSDEMFANLPSDPTAETIGRLGASTILAAPIRGPMAAGAAGNLLMTDSTCLDAVGDAALGAGGGKIADALLRGASGVIAPAGREALQRLSSEGYRPTLGQLIGGRFKNLEDRLTANPVLGPKIDAQRQTGLEQLNRIPANRSLAPIGESLPDNIPAGHEAVAFTGRTLGDAYEGAIRNTEATLDPTFITRLNAIGARANLRPQEIEELGGILQREVGGAFIGGGGKITGRQFKMLDERLNDLATGFRKSDDPYRRQLGETLGQIGNQTKALVRRQNPAQAEAIRKADEGWANFVPYRSAASMNIESGLATPGQMRTAVRMNDRSVGKGATARGEAMMQDLASDASKVVPSGVGSSGTSEREQVNKLAPWLLGSVLSPVFSEGTAKTLGQLMLRKPGPTARTIAELLERPELRALGGAGFPGLIYSGTGY